ncbi:low molecular weight protein-tyrosine-phosphatase [Erythrobacter sp. CCH5-A1]|jgi:protein-tyrosine phosphatase|uniref:low molecular weight protein-tyrosine-phosphatase n=1 Tax=Erythrobacter sp. CCH5-A1 TaxID=1768792 RepID=UPI000834A8C1|nr:low molecular weight protein-tyrosine-phosphatase [Erythrobacter sp. CCH5-A1]
MHGGIDHKIGVLFVCLGNICRSPMAEGAFRVAAQERGLAVLVDSAGTASYHLGQEPDPRAIAAARGHGVDIAGQSARQIERDDFYRFTHIIAMDRANLENLRAKAPRDATARLAMLLDAVEGRRGEPVADPYYGDAAAFEAAWQVIKRGTQAWADKLLREAAQQSA